MKIQYDLEVDALYIEFKTLDPGTAENRDLSKHVTANYGPDGRLAGLEILNASIVLGEGLLGKIIVEVIPYIIQLFKTFIKQIRLLQLHLTIRDLAKTS